MIEKTEKTEFQWRATLEDTFNNQEKLRQKLDLLEEENRCLQDQEERKELFDLLAHSTLGFGCRKSDPILFPDGKIWFFNNIEKTLRYVFYLKNTVLSTEETYMIFHEKIDTPINISFLWRSLKFELFAIFPEALNKAASMSKEREQKDFSSKGGFTFGSEEKDTTR